MMVDYISGDELSKHLGRQMSFQNEKYKDHEPEVIEVKISRFFHVHIILHTSQALIKGF